MQAPSAFGKKDKGCAETIPGSTPDRLTGKVDYTIQGMKGTGTFEIGAVSTQNAKGSAHSTVSGGSQAEARRRECLVLNYSEPPAQGAPSCEEAYEIFLAAGNRLAAADSSRAMADIQGSKGETDQAIATYQRGLGILAGLGEHEKTGAILNNLAINFENQGELDRAEQLYRQARGHWQQAGDRANESVALGNLAAILYERGKLQAASKLYEEVLQVQATLDPDKSGYCLYRLSDLELTEGQMQAARRHAEAAVRKYPPDQDSYQYRTAAMIALGDVLEAQGDLAGARAQIEPTLAIRQKLGDKELVGESQASLGVKNPWAGCPAICATGRGRVIHNNLVGSIDHGA